MTRTDTRERDVQCARCGSSCSADDCATCDGTGEVDHDCGEDVCCCLHPEPGVCADCDGSGTAYHCLANIEWCEAHPMHGAEDVRRGILKWFPVER